MKNKIPKVCMQCDYKSTIKDTVDGKGKPRKSCYLFNYVGKGCAFPRVIKSLHIFKESK